MQNMKIAMILIGAAVVSGGVIRGQGQSPAAGPGPSASVVEIVKARQQGLKALGTAFKTIRDELKADSPDSAKIRTASAVITHAAGAIEKWFPAGSGPESGAKTDAKAEIWTDAAGFAAARDTFIREANKWAQLGDKGDPASWKEAVASLGQSCKGCHDKYREKKE